MRLFLTAALFLGTVGVFMYGLVTLLIAISQLTIKGAL